MKRDVFKRLSYGASSVAIVIGASGLLGWFLDVPLLKSGMTGLVTIKVNTAALFVLVGSALRLQIEPAAAAQIPWVPRACTLLAITVAVLTLLQYLFATDFGIDQLLMSAPAGEVGTSSPGRMAPNTALCFVLVGSALTWLDARSAALRAASQALAIVSLVAGFVATTGYALNVRALYGVAGYTSMAIHTALGFTTLSLGVLCARPQRGLIAPLAQDTTAGHTARRLVPMIVLTPLVVAWFRMQGQRAGYYGTEFGLALMVTVTTALLVSLVLMHARVQGFEETARLQTLRDEHFLLGIGELLRNTSAASEAFFDIASKLGLHLEASRCFFSEIDADHDQITIRRDYHDAVPSLAGTRQLSSLQPEGLGDGYTAVTNDTRTDSKTAARYETDYLPTEIRARVAVPLRRETRWVGLLVVTSREPRVWETREIALIEVVAERAWSWTEHLLSVEAIREREQDLAVTINSSADAIVTTDRAGRVVRMNQVAERLTGWPIGEALKRPLDEVFRVLNEDTKVPATSLVERVLEQGTAVGLANHTLLVARDGSECPISDSAAPIVNLDGSVRGMVIVFRDARLERAAADALRMSEVKYRELYENHPDLCATVMVETGIIVECNHAFARKLGYTKEEVVGRELYDFYDSSMTGLADSTRENLKRERALHDYERVLRHKDGSSLEASVSVTTFVDEGGRLCGRGVWRDISARKQADRDRQFVAGLAELRPLASDAQDLMFKVAERVGTYLSVGRSAFVDIDLEQQRFVIGRDFHSDMRSLQGSFDLAAFGTDTIAAHRAGTTTIVSDTSVDPRTAAHFETAYAPLGMRARIAVPLLRAGRWVGVFSVADAMPRAWRTREVELVESVAERAWLWVEQSRFAAALREQENRELIRHSEERFRRIVEKVQDCAIFLLDSVGNVASWNLGAMRLKGYSEAEILGRHFSVFYTPADIERRYPERVLSLATTAGQYEEEAWMVRKDGTQFWADMLLTPLHDREGKLEGFVKITRDHSERRKAAEVLGEKQAQLTASLKEREVLLQEVHHRVKNNLQVVASLLSMQRRQIVDIAGRRGLDECRARVEAIALVHEQLYRSKDYASVPFSDYAQSLASNILRATGLSPANVALKMDVETISLAVDRAIPCGLILNELITNALKHAFPAERTGEVHVELRKLDTELLLAVGDNGIGMPEGFDLTTSNSMGMRLVTTLVKQLGARLEIVQGSGTTFRVTLPWRQAS